MLCIFNPEHDLCLANGNRHFMPPSSALLFAREGASIMQVVYPEAVAVPSLQAGQAYAALADGTGWQCAGNPAIVPWGWNITLKTQLLKAGIPAEAMPDDSRLDLWRQLQHRSTLLPLQPESRAVSCSTAAPCSLCSPKAVPSPFATKWRKCLRCMATWC